MTVQGSISDNQAAVDTILRLARLSLVADEYERLVRTYPLYREQAAALRIPEARYAQPADIYSAVSRQQSEPVRQPMQPGGDSAAVV